MTVIGTFQLDGVPVLISDVMLSKPGKPHLQKLDLIPTLSSSTRSGEELNLTIAGMVQKVYIPHPHVAVAWAGTEFIARVFCEALKDFLSSQRPLSEKLHKFLYTYPKEDLKSVEIIVIWKTESGFDYFLSGENVHFEMNNSYTNVAIGGSGGEHFFNFIDRHTSGNYVIHLNPKTHLPDLKRKNKEAMAEIAAAIGLAYWATAITEQHFGFVGLTESWGAAFEVTVFDGTRFRKIDRVNLNSFMFRTRDGKKEVANHKLDIWQGYVNKIMMVKDTPGTLYIIPSVVEKKSQRGRVFGKNIKKTAWSVLSVLDEAGEGFSISIGVRRMRGKIAGWEITNDSISVTEEIFQEIRKNGLAIFI
jgi:hypothetical protein